MENKTKSSEEIKSVEWTQTPFGGLVCGVLLLGVIAALLIIYPPEEQKS